MNGGYGAGGGRGSGRRGPGDRDFGDRDPGRGGPYGYGPPAGPGGHDGQGRQQPRRDDAPWPPGQPGGRPPQGPGYAHPQGPGYARPGRGQGPRPGYGQPGERPPPWSQPQRPGAGAGPRQHPQGYDPRAMAPRPAAGGYPPDRYRYQSRGGVPYGQEGHAGGEPGQRAGSFLPGFGDQDDYDYRGEPGPPGPRGPRGRGGRGGGRDDREQRPRRGPVRRLAPWIALVVILVPLLVGGGYAYHLYESKYHPADYSGPGTGPAVTVQVKAGDTAFSLGPRLVQQGVVASARAFELAAERSADTAGLEAGFYRLNRHMQASLAYAALLNPKNRVQLTVTIPEGKRASQVIALLAKDTSIPLADFQQVIDHPAQLGLPSYAKGRAEGYLFPATYAIQPGESALQILRAMVQRYDVEAQQIDLSAAAAKVGLTPGQVIIEASLAQAEGGSVSDYPKIARVISNRLKIGMHLQFDSTVLYGLGKYAVSATIAQTRTPGPYNTYLNPGLPPGPICNPGDAAIQGVLHPAAGNWLYFITRPGGKSSFSATPLAGQ